ncbi:hypothetical protein [Thalassomonas sp. RHCl1]|uniref:hypothetical protein n=1 Tax=Thalassomonas sp. RHCl1 TaxID=2995320 RepID=UPI00248BEC10|nr:hypothetical protein [Thalassomonas sp. RHCl1]
MPRVYDITATGFNISLYEQESLNDSTHRAETIGYLAIYAAQSSGTLSFPDTALPLPFASEIQVVNDQWLELDSGVSIKLDEEQSLDTEVGHVDEDVQLLRLNGWLFGNTVMINGRDTMSLRKQY